MKCLHLEKSNKFTLGNVGSKGNSKRKVLKVDRALSAAPGAKCWTAEILESFKGLEKHEPYTQVVLMGIAINVKDFATDLRIRSCRVWSNLENIVPMEHCHKRASYHQRVASHLSLLNANLCPYKGGLP
eukprot:485463-Pelagomonas_calceolata.AAC.4